MSNQNKSPDNMILPPSPDWPGPGGHQTPPRGLGGAGRRTGLWWVARLLMFILFPVLKSVVTTSMIVVLLGAAVWWFVPQFGNLGAGLPLALNEVLDVDQWAEWAKQFPEKLADHNGQAPAANRLENLPPNILGNVLDEANNHPGLPPPQPPQ